MELRVYSPPYVDGIWDIYGDLIIIYPQPYAIYLRGTIYRAHPEAHEKVQEAQSQNRLANWRKP